MGGVSIIQSSGLSIISLLVKSWSMATFPLICRVSCSTPEWNAIITLVTSWSLLASVSPFTPCMATISLFLSQVINWTGRPVGNGVEYPVREGCSKYDFTVEQIEQKKEKKGLEW